MRAGCAAGQSSLPGTAGRSMESRGARRCRGASPRPAGLGLTPGTTRHTPGLCQSAQGWEAHPAQPSHGQGGVSSPCAQRAQRHRHRRARKGSGRKWRKQDEAGRWRAGGAAVTSAPLRVAKGHLGVPSWPGCPAALPAPGCSAPSCGDTEARRRSRTPSPSLSRQGSAPPARPG